MIYQNSFRPVIGTFWRIKKACSNKVIAHILCECQFGHHSHKHTKICYVLLTAKREVDFNCARSIYHMRSPASLPGGELKISIILYCRDPRKVLSNFIKPKLTMSIDTIIASVFHLVSSNNNILYSLEILYVIWISSPEDIYPF